MKDHQSNTDLANSDWLTEEAGQLAIDAYQTDSEVVVKAPIAGVHPEDLEVTITDDLVTIKGERKREEKTKRENYFLQECYWGSFTRSYVLPTAVDADNAQAKLKDGILTIRIPKLIKSKARAVKIET